MVLVATYPAHFGSVTPHWRRIIKNRSFVASKIRNFARQKHQAVIITRMDAPLKSQLKSDNRPRCQPVNLITNYTMRCRKA